MKIKILNYNFTSVLYDYGTWSVALKDEHALRVYENKVLRRIFKFKKEEVTGCKQIT
jgi:hypothetical protein